MQAYKEKNIYIVSRDLPTSGKPACVVLQLALSVLRQTGIGVAQVVCCVLKFRDGLHHHHLGLTSITCIMSDRSKSMGVWQ